MSRAARSASASRCIRRSTGPNSFSQSGCGWASLLLMGSGLMTAIPLLLFATAARRMSYTALGFVQYLAPTIVFLLGAFVYNEPLDATKLAADMKDPSVDAQIKANLTLGQTLGIDLAAVVLRAPVLVGEQIIGAGHLGELLRRLGIVCVAIGVQLLGELAIGALDRLFVCALRYAQYGIWIGHYGPCLFASLY